MTEWGRFEEDIPTRFEKAATSVWLIVDERGHYYAWDSCSVGEWDNICSRTCTFVERHDCTTKRYKSLESARRARRRVFARCYRPVGIVYFDGFDFEVIVPVGRPKLRVRRSPNRIWGNALG